MIFPIACPRVQRLSYTVHGDVTILVFGRGEQVDLRNGLANLEDRSVGRREDLTRVELCQFRFLKNHDSDSSAVISNLSGIWTQIGIEKESLSSSQFLVKKEFQYQGGNSIGLNL